MSERIIDEVRQKYPGTARAADGGNPRKGIRLFCIECMGGNRGLADACASERCALWPWRFGKGTKERADLYTPLPEKKAAPAGGFGSKR